MLSLSMAVRPPASLSGGTRERTLCARLREAGRWGGRSHGQRPDWEVSRTASSWGEVSLDLARLSETQ